MDIATTVEASAAAVGVLAMLGTGIFGLGKFQDRSTPMPNPAQRPVQFFADTAFPT
jgi:hypothetical protein